MFYNVLQGKDEDEIHYDDEAVAKLLDRSQAGVEEKESWSNEYLGSFKVATYQTKDGEEEAVSHRSYNVLRRGYRVLGLNKVKQNKAIDV